MLFNSILKTNGCTFSYLMKMNERCAENFDFLNNIPHFYKEVNRRFSICENSKKHIFTIK